jgi:putative acetyltransferase
MKFRYPVTVRPYRAADLDRVIDVFKRSVRQIASAHYDWRQIDAWAQADRAEWAAKRASRPTWVAFVNLSMAGFADLEADGHIDMLFVDPAFQRMGVASTLLARIEAEARHDGCERLYTEASITARPFFQRQAFSLIEAQTVTVRGASLDNFRMAKPLTRTHPTESV